jgi:hypothetical protein
VRQWDSMGADVSRLVASPTGSHLVAQSRDALVLGRIDDADVINILASVALNGDDVRLIAARYAPPHVGFEVSAVEVLLSTSSGSELWVVDESGLEGRRPLVASLRAGAGLDAGFLVVTNEGNIGQVATTSPETAILADLGGGWLDVDAANRADGVVFAALRRVGASTIATCSRSAAQLTAQPYTAQADVHTVRVLRRRGEVDSAAGSGDPRADVWLVSDACTCLADLPLASEEARAHPDHLRDALRQRRSGRSRGSVGRGTAD